MRPKATIAGAIVLVLLVCTTLALFIPRKPAQELAVRHINSIRSGNLTTMAFEITNHGPAQYILSPLEVQVQERNQWIEFQHCGYLAPNYALLRVGPMAQTSCAMNVTNLPANSVVRLLIHPQKQIFGLSGFVLRARLNLRHPGRKLSLNPYDKSTRVFGPAPEAVSDAWIEPGK